MPAQAAGRDDPRRRTSELLFSARSFVIHKAQTLKHFLMKVPKCAHGQPKIDPHGSPPYIGSILTHAQRTQGRAPRCWRLFGCARCAVKNGLENRTPIEFKVRFSKSNVAAGSGRSTQIAPASVPTMHAPESGPFRGRPAARKCASDRHFVLENANPIVKSARGCGTSRPARAHTVLRKGHTNGSD